MSILSLLMGQTSMLKGWKKLFTGIGYNVKVRQDPSSAIDFKTELTDLLANFANSDSVVAAVMARG